MEWIISEDGPEPAGATLTFGPFRLIATQQLLMEGETPVALGARALDLLIALTDRAGEVVSKEELMARGWPGMYVEDSNVRVHIAGLRKALRDGEGGKRFIVNVPGRGYSFVAAIQRLDPPKTAPPHASPDDRRSGFPPPISRLIGRTAIVEALCANLAQRRFVTLVGPGGIGKTTVALAVARELSATYADGAVFVDLSPASNPDLVPGIIATALGLAVPVQDAIPAVAAFLRLKKILVVLDNCEHLIEAATIAPNRSRAPGQGSTCWPPAASRCGRQGNGCIGCRRWKAPRLRMD